MRQIGKIEYEDGDGIPAFLCEDVTTGRLAVMFDGGVTLPVQRGQLKAFMTWHGLRLRAGGRGSACDRLQ